MFFMNRGYGERQPYRVEEVPKDMHEDQREDSQQFQDDAEADEHFLQAAKKLYKRRLVATAREIMHKHMLVLSDTLSVDEAWAQIKNHDIKYYPIIGREGKLLGLLSQRDILRHLKEEAKKTLREITNIKTLCADPETALAEILDVFSTGKIEAVPIVDKKATVIGLLTQNDVIQTMVKIINVKL